MSEWTVDTLKAHYDDLRTADKAAVDAALSAAQTAVAAAMAAAEKAVTKAENASEKRFEGVNEFRGTLADQQRTLMPRAEAELRMNAVDARLANMEKQVNEIRGQRVGGQTLLGYIIGGVGIVTFLLRFLLP